MWLAPVWWCLLVSAAGLAVLPLAYHFFPALADRGASVSRALGLLLWGFVFWLLASLGILVNTAGGILTAFAILLTGSYWAWRKIDQQSFRAWLKEARRLLITVEAVFVIGFVFALLLRAISPAVLGTEKPMELAFINAILRSPSMPPLDPWLADYAISYYYFGYVLIGMLAKLSGVSGGVAFNLGTALVFGLAASGAYGLVYNLLSASKLEISTRRLRSLPVLGPLFVLILSNVEGFLEFIHGRGAFWSITADGSWVSSFWTWVNLNDLKLPPPGNTAPGELRFWWWWRASRVVGDYDLAGNYREVIDEFPFFSFLLGDLHPHVLVIPFVLLALTISLNLILQPAPTPEKRVRLIGLEFLFTWQTFLLGAVVFGGLGFLNLWDFPWYVGVFAGVHVLRKAEISGWNLRRVWEFFTLGIAFGLAGVLAYLPFYLSFSSQAGGIMPNMINPTRGVHLWIMFGSLLVPLFAWLIYLAFRQKRFLPVMRGIIVVFALCVGLLVFALAFAAILGSDLFPQLADEFGNTFLRSNGVASTAELFTAGLGRRALAWFSTATLIGLLGLAVGALWPAVSIDEELSAPRLSRPEKFALVLVVIGGLLVLVPEFVFLKDQFGTRMNTIFKFYYQAWIMWAIAAAYGSAMLLALPRRRLAGRVYAVVFVMVLGVGLTYPVMALNTQISAFAGGNEPALTLDGTDNYFFLNQDEQAAANWLWQAPLGTLAEAVHPDGGSYTQYARISMHTGQSAVLGWIGHERQWRGGGDEIGSRQGDLARLYTSGSWEEASQIIDQYQIRYIVVGDLERTTYNVYLDKFIRNLTPVFQQGSVTIFQTDVNSE